MVAVRLIYRARSGRCNSTARLDGKTVIVTGSSAGKKMFRFRVALLCINSCSPHLTVMGLCVNEVLMRVCILTF